MCWMRQTGMRVRWAAGIKQKPRKLRTKQRPRSTSTARSRRT